MGELFEHLAVGGIDISRKKFSAAVDEIADAVGQQKMSNTACFLADFIRKIKCNQEYKNYAESQRSWYDTVEWVKTRFNQNLKETKFPLVENFLKKMFKMFPGAKTNFYRELSYDLWRGQNFGKTTEELLTNFFKKAKKENPKLYEAYKNYYIKFRRDVKKVLGRQTRMRMIKAKRELQKLSGGAAEEAAGRAVRKAGKPGGIKWAGREAAKEGLEEGGKVLRWLKRAGQKLVEFVIKRAK